MESGKIIECWSLACKRGKETEFIAPLSHESLINSLSPSNPDSRIVAEFMPRLIIKDNKGEQLFDMFEDELIIGRSPDNPLVVKDEELSREHFKIYRKEGGFWVNDLKSSNGTKLNGEKIDESPLQEGDVIQVGKTEIHFELLIGESKDYPALEASESRQPDAETKDGTASQRLPTKLSSSGTDRKKELSSRFRITIARPDGTESHLDFEDRELTLGRSSSTDIPVKDEAASGRHAKLVPDEDGYRLVDNGSRNGTFVDGERITEKLLVSGDVIHIGKTELRFLDRQQPPAVAPQQPSEDEHEDSSEQNDKQALEKTESETGIDNWDEIPVRSGDTQRLPVADAVEEWRSEQGIIHSGPNGGIIRLDDIDRAIENLFSDNGDLADTGEAESGVKGPFDLDEEEEEDEEEFATIDAKPAKTKKRKKERRKKKDKEAKGLRSKNLPPEPVRLRRRRAPSHYHQRARQKNLAANLVAYVLATLILGSALWFVLKDEIKEALSDKGKTKAAATSAQQKSGKESSQTTKQGNGGTKKVFEDTEILPVPDIRGMVERGEDVSPDDPSEDEQAIKARPLNATRRVENYDFLKDLAAELAAGDGEDEFTDEDRSRLERAREMVRDFKLQEAAAELKGIERGNFASRNLSHQLKLITELLQRMDASLTSGTVKVNLKEIAAGSSFDGRIIRATASGIRVDVEGKQRLVRWVTLQPEEKYTLAKRCSKKGDAGHHVGLGILCINLGLADEAKTEFNQAEAHGFKEADKYRELLKRRPAILR